jgi:hypothetical protein
MNTTTRIIAAAAIVMCAATSAGAQERSSQEDTRTQYPALLANSYFGANVGYIGYDFTQAQLEPGFHAGSIAIPHVVARVALFGHEFNRFVSVQATYMRPVRYVSYRDVNQQGVNGSVGGARAWMHFGGVTLKGRVPVASRLWAYGEGGIGITSRHGFVLNNVQAVRDVHYGSALVGGGVEYDATRTWSLTAGALYSPGRASEQQPHTIAVTGGIRYTMRPLPLEKVEENRRAGYIFPVNLVQLEVSTAYGYGVNTFVSHKVPVFWGGNVRVDRGIAVHYDRNVFHTRKIFSLDVGASASYWRSQANQQRFSTVSIYPLLRWTFLRTRPADIYAMYSLAGPSYISQSTLDGRDTGNHFTFQDFMGLGAFVGRTRNVSVGVKINHYSNGNILTENAGIRVPITFNVGYAF